MSDMETFRVPVVVFTELEAVDARDAANRAERLVVGALQRSGELLTARKSTELILRDSRNTATAAVAGVQELNVALRNHEFDITVRAAGPTFRDRG